MRTISAAQQAILDAPGGRTVRLRVWVRDGGGTDRDLSTYAGTLVPGLNLVTSGQVKDDIDANGQTATFTFKRNVDGINLSPLMEASPLNRGFNPANSYAPLIDLHRHVKAEVALVPMDVEPQSGDWINLFEGTIDTVKIADGDGSITIECSDLSGDIRDTFIELERVYGYALGDGLHEASEPTGVFIWAPNVEYDSNDWVIPSEANQNTFAYQNQNVGSDTSLPNEPVWPTTPGDDVVDGVLSNLDWVNCGTTLVTRTTAVETIIQQLLDDNLGAGAVTLNCPVSPGFLLRMFQQSRDGLLSVLENLVLLFGWDLRYRYRSGSWQFTLQAVNRAPVAPDYTFSDPPFKWSAMDLKLEGIRTICDVWYSDPTDRDAAGNPKRKRERADVSGTSDLGKRWIELNEASLSPIDTSTEAFDLATNVVADLSQPKADAEAECAFFPFVEVQDFYRWPGDGLLHDQNFDAAVSGYVHELTADGKARTRIQVRGKPSSGYTKWHDRQAWNYTPPQIHRAQSLGLDRTDVSVQPIPGGAQIQIIPPTIGQGNQKDAPPPEYEFHTDVSPGFTPDLSTLQATGRSTLSAPHLKRPGKTYYGQVIPIRHNAEKIVRGLPVKEFSFTAGQAQAGHLSADPDLTRLPLNGSFETQLDTLEPPDHWTESAGTWGTDVTLVTGSATAVTGDSYLSFADTATSKQVDSDLFIVEPYNLYSISAWVQGNFLGDNNVCQIKWYDQNRNAIAGSEVTAGALGVPGGSWRHKRAAGFAPSNAHFGQVQIFQSAPGTAHGFLVDALEVRRLQLTGLLTWGNSAPSAAAVTHYMTPGGGAGATDGNERVLRKIGGEYTLAGLSVRARVASTHVTYAVTLRRNGNDSSLTATLAAGSTSQDDSTHAEVDSKQLGIALADELSIKIVSTIGAGPVAAQDLFVTVGLYQ